MRRKVRLPAGKLPLATLKPILELMPKGELITPTRLGMDAAIIKLQGKYLIFSSGFVRGISGNLLEELVSDLVKCMARRGARPRIINPVILLPNGVSAGKVRHILSKISSAAANRGITIGKGHTEITPWLEKPTIIVTMVGSTDKPLSSEDERVPIGS